MKFTLIRLKPNGCLLFIILLSLFLICSCGGGTSSPDEPTSHKGGISFKVAYQAAAHDPQLRAANLDCTGLEITTVEAMVYGPDNSFLTGSDRWNCNAGEGSISSVKAGDDRIVVILGRDIHENIIFRGQKSNVRITANSENYIGIIECQSFVPSLITPANGSQIEGGAMVLEWDAVSGASKYRVVISQHNNFSDPIIEDVTTTNFTPSGLLHTTTYYWKVNAFDSFEISSISSATWSFLSPDNISPFAQITCPVNGGIYVNGDDIVFTGSGTDREDGNLSGASLVWSSDIDGQLCTGESCSSNLLSAGIHSIALTATDSKGLSWADSVTIAVNANAADSGLPDTGQSTSFTDTSGEDSDFTVNPPAYTKLDASGNPLEACAVEWAMVRDDVTKLIWEAKTDDGSIHDRDNIYDWKRDQPGDLDAHADFLHGLNSENFGGYNDWRLPTVKELSMIVNRNNYDPTINTAYFPNTMPELYWASTTFVNKPDNVWGVHFQYGYSYGISDPHINSNSYPVRAVRGEQVTGNLIDNGDETVTDTATGLMWAQFEALFENGETQAMTWEEALNYCETLELAGHNDWHLPNVNELQSLADYKRYSPALDTAFFPKTEPATYWTSTTGTINTKEALGVQFSDGHIYYYDKGHTYYVRAVRR